MRRSILTWLLILLLGAPAMAQQGAQLGAGQIWANATSGARPGRSTTASALFDQALCSTQGALFSRGASLWQCITTVPLTAGGTGSATAAGARTNLGLGSIATQDASAVAITGGAITGMANPTGSSDVANKSYVDGLATGLHVLAASRLATAAALPNTPTYANGASGVGATLTAGSNSTLTVDGTVAALNDVVLVKDQASAFQNGIYTVTTAGSGAAAWVLTRATYFDQAAEMLAGSTSNITAGSTNANHTYALAANVTTVGTTAATFNLFAGAGVVSVGVTPGSGISVSGSPVTSSGNITVNNTGVLSVAAQTGALTLGAGLKNSSSILLADPLYYRGYIGGLTLSTAGSSATYGIAAGVATDSTSAALMSLASAYTKTTSTWALGTAAGSLDTGAVANSTWYHVFLIQRPDTGVVDVLLSLSATSPTLPTNYTLFRRIGSMKTNGSAQWTSFTQLGDEFLWMTPIGDATAVASGAGSITRVLTAPTGVQVLARFIATLVWGSGNCIAVFSSLDTGAQTAGVPQGFGQLVTASNLVEAVADLTVRTNTAAGINLSMSGAGSSYYIATYGWVDTRGRFQ